MGFLDKFLEALNLNADEEDYDDYEDDDYQDDYEEPSKPKASSRKDKKANKPEADPPSEKPTMRTVSGSSKVTPIRSVKKTSSGMEVCVIKPTSMEDGCEITDTLLSNHTVVLNVEGLDIQVAQRIIDYAAGSSYAINGNLKKISQYIFIITPPSVELSGDFGEVMDTFDQKENASFMDL